MAGSDYFYAKNQSRLNYDRQELFLKQYATIDGNFEEEAKSKFVSVILAVYLTNIHSIVEYFCRFTTKINLTSMKTKSFFILLLIGNLLTIQAQQKKRKHNHESILPSLRHPFQCAAFRQN